jgi:hypothetical protein
VSDDVDDAGDALYGAPLSVFTAERKRLADALKAAGSKAAAAAVNKLARPSMSAWVVNQLWRQARPDMDALLAAGVRVREGDRGGLDDQRAALARLRTAAASVLTGDDHAASPATLQRVATTLQALSALGTWEPDRPGRLLGDRDPPGFDVMLGAVIDVPEPGAAPAVPSERAARVEGPRVVVTPAARPAPPAPVDELATRREQAARKAAAEKATRARVRAAEKALLERAVDGMKRVVVQRTADLANARALVEVAESALGRARAQVAEARAALDAAEARVRDAETSLAAHDDDESA